MIPSQSLPLTDDDKGQLADFANSLFAPRVQIVVKKTSTKSEFMEHLEQTNHQNRVKALIACNSLCSSTPDQNPMRKCINGVTITLENEGSRGTLQSIIAEMKKSDNFNERFLALKGCHGSNDLSYIAKCLSDNSKTIRGQAQRMIGSLFSLNERKGQSEKSNSLIPIITSLPPKEQISVLLWERKRRRGNAAKQEDAQYQCLADKIISEWNNPSIARNMRILCFCSESVILSHCELFWEKAKTKDWWLLSHVNPLVSMRLLELWSEKLLQNKNDGLWNMSSLEYPIETVHRRSFEAKKNKKATRFSQRDPTSRGRGSRGRSRGGGRRRRRTRGTHGRRKGTLGTEDQREEYSLAVHAFLKAAGYTKGFGEKQKERVKGVVLSLSQFGITFELDDDYSREFWATGGMDTITAYVERTLRFEEELKKNGNTYLHEYNTIVRRLHSFSHKLGGCGHLVEKEAVFRFLAMLTKEKGQMDHYVDLDMRKMKATDVEWIVDQPTEVFADGNGILKESVLCYLPPERRTIETRAYLHAKEQQHLIKTGQKKPEDFKTEKDTTPFTTASNLPFSILNLRVVGCLPWDEFIVFVGRARHLPNMNERECVGGMFGHYAEVHRKPSEALISALIEMKNDAEEVRTNALSQIMFNWQGRKLKKGTETTFLAKVRALFEEWIQLVNTSDLTHNVIKQSLFLFGRMNRKWELETQAWLEEQDAKKYRPTADFQYRFQSIEETETGLAAMTKRAPKMIEDGNADILADGLSFAKEWVQTPALNMFVLSLMKNTRKRWVYWQLFSVLCEGRLVGKGRKESRAKLLEMKKEFEETGKATMSEDRLVVFADGVTFLRSILPSQLSTRPSIASQAKVALFLQKSRQDLLTPSLRRMEHDDFDRKENENEGVLVGVVGRFVEGSAKQQELYREELLRVLREEKTEGLSLAVGMEKRLSKLACVNADWFWKMVSVDEREKIVHRGVTLLSRMDDVRGQDVISSLLTDEAVGKIAVDLFRSTIASMPSEQAISTIVGLRSTTPGEIKGQIRLFCILPPSDAVFSAMMALSEKTLPRDALRTLISALRELYVSFAGTWALLERVASTSDEDELFKTVIDFSSLKASDLRLKLKEEKEGVFVESERTVRDALLSAFLTLLDKTPAIRQKKLLSSLDDCLDSFGGQLEDGSRRLTSKIVTLLLEPVSHVVDRKKLAEVSVKVLGKCEEADRTDFFRIVDHFDGERYGMFIVRTMLVEMSETIAKSENSENHVTLRTALLEWVGARRKMDSLVVLLLFILFSADDELFARLEKQAEEGRLSPTALNDVMPLLKQQENWTKVCPLRWDRQIPSFDEQRAKGHAQFRPAHALCVRLGESKHEVLRYFAIVMWEMGGFGDEYFTWYEKFVDDKSELISQRMWSCVGHVFKIKG